MTQPKPQTYKELYLALRSDYRKLKRQNAKLAVHRKLSFSKAVMLMVMLSYFAVLALGVYAVIKILLDYPEWAVQALIALFTYVGTPTGVSIGFYSWKAKNENALKIKNTNEQRDE